MLWQIPLAYSLDLILGDPTWFPHPVRGIGWLIQRLEKVLRRDRAERLLGCLLPLMIVGGTYGLTSGILLWAARLHPMLHHGLTVGVLWTSLATRDLYVQSKRVQSALLAGDPPKARRMLSHIVGRDTETLDEAEIVRATIETIGENLVDGVTAPLFYIFLGGAPAVLAYKAANTLDSMVGYRNGRYKDFGWASARLDDALNFLPARMTGMLIPLVAAGVGLNARQSWHIFWRDRKKHPSPNSAHAEAAFAGALQVQLGGISTYGGVPSHKEFLGEAKQPFTTATIRRAHRLMFGTSLAFLVIGWIIRSLF